MRRLSMSEVWYAARLFAGLFLLQASHRIIEPFLRRSYRSHADRNDRSAE